MLPKPGSIPSQAIDDSLLDETGISLSVLRLDTIHPVVSGNKLFKLHWFLQKAMLQNNRGILTFGGAHSNHLVATSFACRNAGIKSIGIVRGERPGNLSHTLKQCMEFGMQLKFISREAYRNKDDASLTMGLENEFSNFMIVPEGGYSPEGAEGAAQIMKHIDEDTKYICCAMGTATTVAGLLSASNQHQQVIAVPVLKGMNDVSERINFLLKENNSLNGLHIADGYHFGGYAKYSKELFDFMNRLFAEHQLLTDFVYTGKMMFAVYDLINKKYFTPGNKIVCVHTGGLQGNLSLPAGTLTF